MTFAIVIPTYNGSEYVAQAIESALSQTRRADEIIISDDNSSDNTIEICKRYSNRVRICQHDGPSGFVNGWNKALAYAESDFISILHQDDLLLPSFLEEIENVAIANPDVKHFFVPCNYVDSNGISTDEPNYCDGLWRRYSGKEYVRAYQTIGRPRMLHIHRCPGVVTHRDIFKICQYNEAAGHIADDDFFYRVGQYTDVVGMFKTLASYRLHATSETGHLEKHKLVSRLAKDYQYQVRQWSDSDYITGESLDYFKRYAQQFAFEEILFGIQKNDIKLYTEGIEDWRNVKDLGTYLSFKPRLFLFVQRTMGFQAARILTALSGNNKK